MTEWIQMTPAMVERFRTGFDRAVAAGVPEPTAMTLATLSGAGHPSGRTVLLKDMDAEGFVFYTNLESRKGRHLAVNPRVSLVFWWRELAEQIIADGRAERVSDAEADAYFATRPRGSQIGAWASKQSTELASRQELEARVAHFDDKFAGGEVPRPAHWSGFRVRPFRVEFWYGRESRLHDRICFDLAGGQWREFLLYP